MEVKNMNQINHPAYDVIVAGGGLGGVAAAIASARTGAKTILIERHSCLGGVATAGMCCSIFNCYYPAGEKPGVQGIPVEIADRIAEVEGFGKKWHKHKGHIIYDTENAKYVLEQMVLEAGVEIMLDAVVTDAIVENNAVSGVVIQTKSGRSVIRAKVTVDSTADADVAWLAGTPLKTDGKSASAHSLCFRMGNVDVDAFVDYFRKNPGEYSEYMDVDWTVNEAFAQYDECGTFLFPHGGGMQMMAFRKAKASGKLPAVVGIHDTTDACQMHAIRRTRMAHVVTGFVHFDGLDAGKITQSYIDGRKMARIVSAVYREYIPGFENSCLDATATSLGVRATRFLDGDFFLSIAMMSPGNRFVDAVGRAVSIGYMKKHPAENAWGVQVMLNDTYDIPLRSLLPKGVDNLIIGSGRSISAEDHSILRAMVNTMIVGQGAGTAAAVAAKNGNSLRECNILEIQKELCRQGGLT